MFSIGMTRLQRSNCRARFGQVLAVLHEFQGSPIEWFLREVRAPSTATIAIPLVQGVLSFEWRFDSLPDGRALISQRITLEGEDAEAYRSQVALTFAANLPNGMAKIAKAITEAHAHYTDEPSQHSLNATQEQQFVSP